MRSTPRLAALCVVIVAASPVAQPGMPEGTWRIADAPGALRSSISRADLVIVAMQDALRRELTTALEEGGPSFAIKSCHVDVAGITRRLGRQGGLAAGRTSHRLRNPANAARPWAAALVHRHAASRADEIDGYAVDLGTAVGVLRPIAHRPMCGSCHGVATRLDPDVRAALAERYPGDAATGFRDGDLRGWFWVEIPKRQP